MDRDVLAGHNMCNIMQGHLLDPERPHYLQPVYADGTLVWTQTKDVKDQDLLESSIPSTAKDASEDEPGDSSQKRRAMVKHAPSAPAKIVSMDEPQDTSQPGRTPVKRALSDPLEEDTPPTDTWLSWAWEGVAITHFGDEIYAPMRLHHSLFLFYRF